MFFSKFPPTSSIYVVLRNYAFSLRAIEKSTLSQYPHWVCGLSNILKYLKTLGLSTPCCPHGISNETRLQMRFAYLFLFSNSLLPFSTASWGKINLRHVSQFGRRVKSWISYPWKSFDSLSSVDVEVSQIGDWLVFFKCLLFLERSDSFPAVSRPFIISALRWNLCPNGKISAEEVQPNGNSCSTMFQPESFQWLVIDVSDVSISWRLRESCLPNQINDLRIGNSSKN